jgi:lycopene beta-cyclase
MPCFDPGMAVFMDFRVSQQHGAAFMYCLPVSATEALVEYTLFSEALLPDMVYEAALQEYIAGIPGIGNYAIVHSEKGAIPMTNARYPLREGRIVHIGIAGGQVKGSSGYAFRFIQKRTAAIVASLAGYGHPDHEEKLFPARFHLYDSILLRVLKLGKMGAPALFAGIFRHNPPARVLRFLDNETSLADDLRIMQSVPARVFLPAALAELFL